MPDGLLETVPVPVPARLTDKSGALWEAVNVAVTCWLALIVTVQVELEPLQAPLHPANAEFAAGVAVRVTLLPGSKVALHVWPQSMPAGLLVTVPVPVPARATSNEGFMAKEAVTERLLVSVT